MVLIRHVGGKIFSKRIRFAACLLESSENMVSMLSYLNENIFRSYDG